MVSACKYPDCVSFYQDSQYGKGNRVFNPAPKSKGTEKVRCANCGRDK